MSWRSRDTVSRDRYHTLSRTRCRVEGREMMPVVPAVWFRYSWYTWDDGGY